MLGSRTSFPLVMVNLIIDWFFDNVLVENLLSEVSDQRKTIYKLLLAKPLDRLRQRSLSIDCTIIKGLFGMSCLPLRCLLRRRIFFNSRSEGLPSRL
jgi:hypothetical protein